MDDVKVLYEQYLKQGMTPKDAAKTAQAQTGKSAVTGRPLSKQLKFTTKGINYGQYHYPN